MIPNLKDDRFVCNLCWGNLEVDGVVVDWVGSALHLVACLHLLIRGGSYWNPGSQKQTYIGSAWQEHSAHIAVRCPSKQVGLG